MVRIPKTSLSYNLYERKDMNMKRTVILMVVMILLMTGCAKKEEPVLDAKEVATRLETEVTYEGNLEQMDDDMIAILYDVNPEDVKTQIVYCSTDATADEIAVFEATSNDAAKRILEIVKQRVEDEKLSYEGYNPAQVDKLAKAITIQSGNVVVLNVSSDSEKAKKIVKGEK